MNAQADQLRDKVVDLMKMVGGKTGRRVHSEQHPFTVQWSRFFDNDLSEIETTIHKELDEYRVNRKRESFELSVSMG